MRSYTRKQLFESVLIAALMLLCIIFLFINAGLHFAVIVGISGIAAYLFWQSAYHLSPASPKIILPAYLITFAIFIVQLVEEYSGHYAPAISRLFDIGLTDRIYLLYAITVTIILTLTAIGLYYRNALAGFVAILFLISRIAKLVLFFLPLIRPSIHPEISDTVSQETAAGIFVKHMPNYYFSINDSYYFPGMYSAIVVIIPAVYCISRIWKRYHFKQQKGLI